jgi:uncharacterized protein YndB with AHSA1/START domain
MSAVRRQAVIDAPVQEVWDLVGDPLRHPDWFPKVVEVNGERFVEGERYAQVTRDPNGKPKQTDFLIERLDNLHEVRLACQASGMYVHWQLTDAQGDTFVEVEMGMQPKGVGNKLFDAVAGRRYFTRWLDQSIDALRRMTAPHLGPSAGDKKPSGPSSS